MSKSKKLIVLIICSVVSAVCLLFLGVFLTGERLLAAGRLERIVEAFDREARTGRLGHIWFFDAKGISRRLKLLNKSEYCYETVLEEALLSHPRGEEERLIDILCDTRLHGNIRRLLLDLAWKTYGTTSRDYNGRETRGWPRDSLFLKTLLRLIEGTTDVQRRNSLVNVLAQAHPDDDSLTLATKLVIEGAEDFNRISALVPPQIEHPYQDILLAIMGWAESSLPTPSSRFRKTLLHQDNLELRKVSLTSALCWADRDLANTILTRMEEEDMGLTFLRRLVWVRNPTHPEVNTLLQDYWIRLWEKHGGRISLGDKHLILFALQQVGGIGAVDLLVKIARDSSEHEAIRENAAGVITQLEKPMSEPVWNKCMGLAGEEGLPQYVRVAALGGLLLQVENQLLESGEDLQLESRRLKLLSLLENLVASMRTDEDLIKMARLVSSRDSRVIQKSKALEILQHILSVAREPRTRADVKAIKEGYKLRCKNK